MDKKDKVNEIIKIFDIIYPDAGCSLKYKDALQLLVSTQLSAQCTDARVNIVTERLFKRYKNAYDFANTDIAELEEYIRPVGFFRNKARNIINCCSMLVYDYNGKIPDRLEDMLKLPGVGRKTANLVLGDIYGIPGIVVDTHANRLSKRIGLTKNYDPKKIEFDLMKVVDKKHWIKFCHQLVFHGRSVCKAKNPLCNKCEIIKWCDYGKNLINL